MAKIINSIILCLICYFNPHFGQEKISTDELFNLDLEDFLNVEVISASKKSEKLFTAPATIYVITAEEIERMGFQHLQEALKYIPSIYLYNPHSWMWGGQRGLVSNFSQTLLLINGREVNNLIAQEGFISRQFATHNIERIEVLASPGSALYGANALAGVINIITKEANPNYQGIEMFMESGSYNTYSMSLVFGEVLGNFKIKGSIRQFNSEEANFKNFIQDTINYSKGWEDNDLANSYLIEYENPSEAFPVNLQVDYKDYYIGINYYFNKQSQGLEKLRWNYTDGEDNREFSLLYSGVKSDINDKIKMKLEYQHIRSYMWGRYHSGLWPVSRLESSGNFEVYSFPEQVISSNGDTLNSIDEIKGYYSSFAHYLIDQDLLDSDNISSSDIQKYFTHIYSNKNSRGSQRNKFDLLFNWQLMNNIIMDVGYNFDHIDYVGLAVTDAATGLGATYNIPIDLSKRKDVYQSYKHGMLLQLNTALYDKKMYLNLGIRYDYQNHYGASFNPRFGIIWQPSENDVLKMLYGESYREPNVFELSSDPDVEPAKLRSLEANYSRNFGNVTRIGLTGYYNIVSNFLGSVGSLIGTGVGKVEKQQITGLELQTNFRFNPFLVFINGAYIMQITQDVKDNQTGNIESFDVLSIPDKKANVGISYSLSQHFTFSLLYSYIDQYEAHSGNELIDNLFSIDASNDLKLTLKFGEFEFANGSIVGFITINNLTDENFYHANIRRSGPNKFLQEGRNLMFRIQFKN